ncbi:MAG: AAA family ATPase [Bacteroidales bacterium]
MELLYVWIKQFKGINELGLNFSNKYYFNYIENEKKVSINQRSNYIPSFFGANISNLTAIVGENGTGKTTILRYLIEYISGGIHNHADEQGCIFFKLGEQLYYFSTFDIIIEASSINKTIIHIDNTEKIRSSVITIFASNTFDPTSYYARDYLTGQLGDTKNLSTWFLLYSDYQNKTGEDAFIHNLTFEQRFSSFASQEFIRMVRLLRWLNSKDAKGHPFPVNLPKYLNLKLYFNENENYTQVLKKVNNELIKYFKITQNNKNGYLLQTLLVSLSYFMNEIKFINGPDVIFKAYNSLPEYILDYIKNNVYENNPKDSIISEIHRILYNILKKDENHILHESLGKIQAFLEKLDRFIQTPNVEISKDFNFMSVELSKANKSALEYLIDEYYNADRISGFADFFFSHTHGGDSTISSGEYAMLILFARLNSIKVDSRKPLIILIDEAELALHPQWQKEFIYHFTDFITERFSSHKVQIIITAHSPFILSDMPQNSVVLLKKQNGKSIVENSLEKKTSTFGANIHELFTDSFFLQNGLMGEFARKKIADLINEIKDTIQISKEDYELNYKSRIAIIGEPLIQSKLFELVAQKVDHDVIDSIIEQRVHEIEILKQIKNKKRND